MSPLPLPLADAARKIHAATQIVIVLPDQLTKDTLAAATTLFGALKYHKTTSQTPIKKQIQLCSSQPLPSPLMTLKHADQVTTSLGSKNLVVSLAIDQEQIEKVSYDHEVGKFNLVIETKDGVKRLTDKAISYSYRGLKANLVIAIGVHQQDQIAELLRQEAALLADRESILIAANPLAQAFATVNLIDGEVSGVCELIGQLIRYMKLSISADEATNLIAGIEAATNELSTKTTADTFATLSWAMRRGGQRHTMSTLQTPRPFSSFSTPPAYPRPNAGYRNPLSPAPLSPMPPLNSSSPYGSSPSPFEFPAYPVPTTGSLPNNQPSQPKSNPQQDWLEPKIFKGGKNV